ncbi:SPOR domain-containing protein [Gaoshiqia sediminis]|uniref:Tetratricopeptide repeat protein n=1 Tax=Gaoshiqia sediminis TaxID=2986998 RepID=A0AA41Y961_9BACT|nr:tetratricopeptide repeat protein [Gaoshiqia sediminis]MCW0483532.1 tetratricopeptide repeat protein [Gaoshiqia sediminis]
MLLQIKQYLKTSLLVLMFSLVITVSGNIVFAQTDPEMQAKQLFNEGDYEKALPVFRDLARLYPDDEELNFYLGASLAETEEFTKSTYSSLRTASAKFPKAYYYLGQYFQATSDWENAEKSYQQFISTAKKKEVGNTRAKELLDMCKNKINPFKTPAIAIALPDTIQATDPVTQIIEETPKPELAIEIPQLLEDTVISFQVNSQIKYLKVDQFKNESSRQAFIKGWLIEQDLQAKLEQIGQLRQAYESSHDSVKTDLAGQILTLEQDTYQLNQQARNAYLEANEKEANYWGQASESEINNFRETIQRMQDSIREAATAKKLAATPTAPLVILTDTAVVQPASEMTPSADVVVYKIQIGAYSKTPPDWVQRQFKKLSVIRRIDQYTDNKGVTVYTVGELKNYQDALQMQKQVKLEGIQDAIIAAYKNNERISVSEARKITEQ